jgi:hypothetical protein
MVELGGMPPVALVRRERRDVVIEFVACAHERERLVTHHGPVASPVAACCTLVR